MDGQMTLDPAANELTGRFALVAVERGIESSLGKGGPEGLTYRVEDDAIGVGDRVEVPLGRKKTGGIVLAVGGPELASSCPPGAIKPIQSRSDVRLPAPLLELARWISSYYICPLGMTLATMLPAAVKKPPGPRASKKPPKACAMPEGDPSRATAPTPTAEQRRVIDGVARTFGGFAPHLLFGVTGAGKTEVYIRLIEHALAQGRGALLLVPEISLTPQTLSWFAARLRDVPLAVVHSGVPTKERRLAWHEIAAGQRRVVIGARSAVFAPVQNLGLIIVDEEHESSYKQEQLPRYNARDVAIKRAQIESCPVLLGSATPSLESWANAAGEQAKFSLWRLPSRVGGGELPSVRIVDLAQERRALASQGESAWRLVGPQLRGALTRTLGEGGQAIMLLNRRGYANLVSCPNSACGWTSACSHCDASMVLHKPIEGLRGSLVRCHHCGAQQIVPAVCAVCGKKTIAVGVGTQRVEEELAAVFPELTPGQTMLRLDSDTQGNWNDLAASLARFARGEVRVLLGTQMIAKGLDVANVRLVGVLNADTALAIPDFRSTERTFQLLSQVSGRAGRGDKPGVVIMQTFNPTHPAVTLAARHDYESFARGELALRHECGLPPITRMVRIVCRHQASPKARERAQLIADALCHQHDLRVTGPIEPPLTRLAGYWRFAVEAIAPSAGVLQKALGHLRGAGVLKSDAQTAVDVDPLWLM